MAPTGPAVWLHQTVFFSFFLLSFFGVLRRAPVAGPGGLIIQPLLNLHLPAGPLGGRGHLSAKTQEDLHFHCEAWRKRREDKCRVTERVGRRDEWREGGREGWMINK